MLEELDRVDWERLTDAYGTAEEVPLQIRGLLSPDGAVRKQAVGGLHARICHQGSRYRASAPAVPFLFELLQAPDTPAREAILDLLICLALGYAEDHLPFGFDPGKQFARLERLARKVDLDALRAADPEEDDDFDPGLTTLWASDAYAAVEREVAVFRRLARDDEALRPAALRALAWFPRVAEGSVPVAREIAGRASAPRGRASALLCLGILDRSQQDLSDIPSFQSCLDSGQPPGVRLAAAISLGVVLEKKLPPEALEILLEAVQHRLGESAGETLAGWHMFGPATYAANLLAAVRPRATEPVVSSLCRAAESDDTWARAAVWTALLSVVFRKPKRVRFMSDPNDPESWRTVYLDPGTLSAVQARALQAISRNPVWNREESLCDHHMDVCLAFGIPWHRKQLRELVAAATPGRSGRGQ